MKIEISNPPNFAEILIVFPKAAEHGVVFAWGDTIYNPSGVELHKAIIKHEEAHGERQGYGFDIDVWWQQYLIDPEFRYREELKAHAVEYRALCSAYYDRTWRARLVHSTARRLAAPLYAYQNLTFRQAVADLTREIENVGA